MHILYINQGITLVTGDTLYSCPSHAVQDILPLAQLFPVLLFPNVRQYNPRPLHFLLSSSFSSFLSFKHSMALPPKRRLYLHKELPPHSRADTFPPGSVFPRVQLHFCAQRRQTPGSARVSAPTNSPSAVFSCRITQLRPLDASTPSLFGSFGPSPY